MSANDDRPPRITPPGGNPELDTLLHELRRDGDGGDPLFPKRDRPKERGVEEEKAPASGGAAQATTVGVGAPGSRMRTWWLTLGVLVIVAPLVALGLGLALRAPVVELRPALPEGGDAVGAGAAAPIVVVLDGGARELTEDAGAKQQDADAGVVMKRGEPRPKAAEPKTDAADAGKIEAPAAPRHEPGTDIW